MPVVQIDVQTARSWIDAGQACVVDVRELVEYEARHIPDAVHLPLGKIAAGRLPVPAGRKVIMQCKGGVRSMSACAILQKQQPDETFYSLSGGIDAWVRAGFPVAGSGRAVMPLDRQVQLTIGLGLIMFTVLAWFVSPYFLAGTGILGCGLTFAGLTGFCGLARMMARAPWNRAGAATT